MILPAGAGGKVGRCQAFIFLGGIKLGVSEVLEVYRNLAKFDEGVLKVLSSKYSVLSSWVDELVNSFYDTLYSWEKTRALLEGKDRKRLERTLRDWYLTIVSGDISDDFWKRQWRVGLVHVANGVSNLYFISMMDFIRAFFTDKVKASFDKDEAVELIKAFNTITSVIVSLVVEGYVDAFVNLSGMDESLVHRLAQLGAQEMIDKDG